MDEFNNEEITFSLDDEVIGRYKKIEVDTKNIRDVMDKRIEKIDVSKLKDIALFLQGYKVGKGDLEPLGDYAIEAIWKAHSFMKTELNIQNAEN